MTLELAQTIAIILGAIGGLNWVGVTVRNALRSSSENKVDDANAESISVATLSATVKTLNAQLEAQDARHKREMAELSHQVESFQADLQRVLDELAHERKAARDRTHELDAYRMALVAERERVALLEARVSALETALREADIDPKDIYPEDISP